MIFRGNTLKLALKTTGREPLRYWYIANSFTADTAGHFTLDQFLDQFKTITGQTLQKHLLKSRLTAPFFTHISGQEYKSVGRKLLGCTRSTWRADLTLDDLSSKGKFTEFCVRACALRDRFVPYSKMASTTGIHPGHAKRVIAQAVKARKIRKTNNHVILHRGNLEQIQFMRQHLLAQGVVTLPPQPEGQTYLLLSYHANLYWPVDYAHKTTVRVKLPICKLMQHEDRRREDKECWIKPYDFKVNCKGGKVTNYRKVLVWSFNREEYRDKWNNRRGI